MSLQSWYTDPAVADVCAQFNKAFIFKARLCLLLIFSSSVLGCSLWDVQQHSSYYSICASKPAQNNKNEQVCLFAVLVWVKLNGYMAVLSVVQFRSSSGIKKNMKTTFLEPFAELDVLSYSANQNHCSAYISLTFLGGRWMGVSKI